MRKTGARPTNHALASARGRGIRTRNIAKTRSKPCNTMCTSARQQPNSNAQWTWSTQWAFRPVKSYQSSKPGRQMSARCNVRKMRGWVAVNMLTCIACTRRSPSCATNSAYLRTIEEPHHEVGYTRESESGSSRLSVADPQVHRSTGRVPIRACRPGHGGCQARGCDTRDVSGGEGECVRTFFGRDTSELLH